MHATERLISADSHVSMSHDQVKRHLPSRFHDDYDRGVARYQERMRGPSGAAVTAFNDRNWNLPGHFDPVEHLHDMDTDGVDVEVVYCEVSSFRYLYLLGDAGPVATRAFNDALAEYGSADRRRLVVTYQIPIHDIALAISEVQRIASMGGRSLQLPVFPAELGLPDYYHERYDALWSAIIETGLPVCCHTGLNTNLDDVARRDPTPQRAVLVPMMALSAAEALGMWIMGGVFERFPQLEVVFVEPGLGWVAWWLKFVDDMVTKQGYVYPAITELPSYYFHRNIRLTFIEEADAVQLLRHRLGVDNLMWSSDYPHPPSSWPNSRAVIAEQFRGVADDERRRIVCDNAASVWGL